MRLPDPPELPEAARSSVQPRAMLPIVPVPALLIGAAVLLACLLVPSKVWRWPSPVPA